jgi:putative DNA primase/helicase
MLSNYNDVLDQLHAEGLVVENLETGRLVRCKVEGDRERRGWYSLHELITSSGETIIVGSFGIWRGADNGARKVELRKVEISPEQRDAIKRRIAEDRRRADAVRAGEARRAAERATRAWAQCSESGECDYLARKHVGAHGVRFSASGALAIPMLDTAGKIHGLQIIRSRKVAKAEGSPEKQYWPQGAATKGHFHLIGSPQWILLVCEGYATGASLYEATNYPVAIAFDAANLGPVASALRKRYRNVQILICADDDILRKCKACQARVILAPGAPPLCAACGKEHAQDNVGVVAASTAAVEVGGAYVVPQFPDPVSRAQLFMERGVKLTDFNDLHVLPDGGLQVVRTQIEARISELGLRARQLYSAVNHDGGAGGKPALRPIGTVDELHRRFALVYGQGGAVFDRSEHMLVTLKDMSDACTNKYLHRTWMESYDRAIVRIAEVGFDPGGEDPKITCNLWGGWPTRPAAGQCEKLLELLRHMCYGDEHPDRLYRWMLCWLAYPIRHPGAKMKTTVVLHSPQGTGKNLFFEAVMAIYGQYGRVIGQDAMEDKFNDWASRKLFLIADEVVARSDAYHIKNKLKAFITGDWIRINPKNIAAYDERNHVNIVFLSNESVPVVLEQDDRRHTVIWTPTKLTKEFYAEVKAEIANGGIEALHDYLLNYDTGEFHTATEPIETSAKKELINQSLDSTVRFIEALWNGEVGNVPSTPMLTQEFYDLYKFWCVRVGERAAPLKRLENVLARKFNVPKVKKRFMDLAGVARNPQAFYLFGFEVPDGQTEASWLGECVDAFREAVKQYRGSACD